MSYWKWFIEDGGWKWITGGAGATGTVVAGGYACLRDRDETITINFADPSPLVINSATDPVLNETVRFDRTVDEDGEIVVDVAGENGKGGTSTEQVPEPVLEPVPQAGSAKRPTGLGPESALDAKRQAEVDQAFEQLERMLNESVYENGFYKLRDNDRPNVFDVYTAGDLLREVSGCDRDFNRMLYQRAFMPMFRRAMEAFHELDEPHEIDNLPLGLISMVSHSADPNDVEYAKSVVRECIELGIRDYVQWWIDDVMLPMKLYIGNDTAKKDIEIYLRGLCDDGYIGQEDRDMYFSMIDDAWRAAPSKRD